MAIIDENVKAVDGSRVRLRLLDDIEIGDETIKKGTYLYATMSGFGKQRVQGKVESIFYDDDIIKVSLSIYDTDGMQGLYVPLSSFRKPPRKSQAVPCKAATSWTTPRPAAAASRDGRPKQRKMPHNE